MIKDDQHRQRRRAAEYERSMTASGFRFRPTRPQQPRRHESPREQLSLFDQDKIQAALARMDGLGL